MLLLLLGCSIQIATAAEGYEYVTQWGVVNSPHGTAVDSAGNVYVTTSFYHGLDYWGPPYVEKFTSSGTFVTKWAVPYEGDKYYMNYPDIIAVDSADNVYVADYNNAWVQKFTSDGTFITKWGSFGSGDGQFKYPRGIAVDRAGNVYVADTYNCRIQKFTSIGTFVTKWGSIGSGNGQFLNPSDIAVDRAGNVYVADTSNNRIQKFTSTGTFVTKWGTEGSTDGQFSGISGIALDNAGNVYVADAGNNRIQKFTSTGVFITKWGSEGSGDGQFIYLHRIAVDSAGNVYVADNGNSRVQKFAPMTSAPTANFMANVSSSSVPLTVQFTDTSTGSPTSWAWSFGDGATSTKQHPVHVYSKKGVYTVSLRVLGSKGWSKPFEQTVRIRAQEVPLAASFSASPVSGKAPLTVRFTDASTGGPVRWSWTFGDGMQSRDRSPTHVYARAGTYTVQLTVTDAARRTATVTRTALVTVTKKK